MPNLFEYINCNTSSNKLQYQAINCNTSSTNVLKHSSWAFFQSSLEVHFFVGEVGESRCSCVMEGPDWSDVSHEGSCASTEFDNNLSDVEEVEPLGSVQNAQKRSERSLPLTQAKPSPSPVRKRMRRPPVKMLCSAMGGWSTRLDDAANEKMESEQFSRAHCLFSISFKRSLSLGHQRICLPPCTPTRRHRWETSLVGSRCSRARALWYRCCVLVHSRRSLRIIPRCLRGAGRSRRSCGRHRSSRTCGACLQQAPQWPGPALRCRSQWRP